MEIKINLNINLENFNQILDKLSNKDIDITKLRQSIGEATKSGNLLAVQNLLKKYNAKTLVEVDKKDYNSLYSEILKINN